jgi:hypothetical protein
MSDTELLVPEVVLAGWQRALGMREPRAMELAYALALALPEGGETADLQQSSKAATDSAVNEVAEVVKTVLDEAAAKYDSFHTGEMTRIDMGNASVLGFERAASGERVLVVSNLTAESQPIKFQGYAGKEGWDILNRVEFVFPARAQLEPYEFLWLLVE